MRAACRQFGIREKTDVGLEETGDARRDSR